MRDEDSFLTERVEKNYTEEPPEIVVLPSARETSNSKIKRGTKQQHHPRLMSEIYRGKSGTHQVSPSSNENKYAVAKNSDLTPTKSGCTSSRLVVFRQGDENKPGKCLRKVFLADLKKSEESLKLSRNKGGAVLHPTAASEELNLSHRLFTGVGGGGPMKPREMNGALNESKGRISLNQTMNLSELHMKANSGRNGHLSEQNTREAPVPKFKALSGVMNEKNHRYPSASFAHFKKIL